MNRISKGTVSVANGGTTVTLWAGDDGVVLSEITAPAGSMVIIEGVANFIASRTSTTEFELVQPHSGAGGAGLACTISAMTATETSIGTLNARTATVIQELSVLDANGRGLFYNLIGVTGANDPGPGKLAFNNADPAAVTELYFDVLDANDGGRDVSGILDLWPTGTVLIVRSLASTAYAAFRASSTPVDTAGYRTVAVTFISSDGTLAEEPVAIEWRIPGEALDYNAEAADPTARSVYDAQIAGFSVLVADMGDGRAALTTLVTPAEGENPAVWATSAYVTGPKGNTGAKGDKGDTGDTGAIGVNWRGPYDGGTEYALRDGVSHLGSSWRYINAVPSTGNAPPALPTESNAHWTIIARKGNDGAGTIAQIVAGDGIAVDSTDPTAPVISTVLEAEEQQEWLVRAAILDPAAYCYWQGRDWSVTVPAGETWLVLNAWLCAFRDSTGWWFHRDLQAIEALEIPAGTTISAAGPSSFLYVCRPALVAGDARYVNARALYFERLAELRGIALDQITARVPAGSAPGTTVTANFPTDFADALLMQVSSYDVSWTVLYTAMGAGGLNTLDEISDNHQMRLTGKLLVPIQRSMFPAVAAKYSSVSGDGVETSEAGESVLLYHKLPVTWRSTPATAYRNEVLGDTPILYYPFDGSFDDVGSNLVDISVASPIYLGECGATGDNGISCGFKNTDDGHLSIPAGAGLDFGAGDFTIEAWVRFRTIPNLASADPWIINAWQNSGASPNCFLLSVYSQKLRFFWKNTDGVTTTVDSTIILETNRYYHVVCGREGGTIFIRIDQEARQTAAVTGTMAPLGTNPVLVGIGADGVFAFAYQMDGAVDELAFYNSALSDARADAHHAEAIGW